MYSRRSASRPDLLCCENSTLTLTQDDALSVLEYWQASAEQLMVVYRMANEHVTRIGHGCIRDATAHELRIDMGRSRLRVVLHSAAFEFRTLGLGAARHPRESECGGLLIRPELGNWIFIRAAPRPGSTRPPHHPVEGLAAVR